MSEVSNNNVLESELLGDASTEVLIDREVDEQHVIKMSGSAELKY